MKKKNTTTKGMKLTAVDNKKITDVEKFLRAIADPRRLRILCLVRDEFMTVTEIHTSVGIAQNLASHHIGQLKKLDLLIEKPEGIFRRYRSNEKKLKEYTKLLGDLWILKK